MSTCAYVSPQSTTIVSSSHTYSIYHRLGPHLVMMKASKQINRSMYFHDEIDRKSGALYSQCHLNGSLHRHTELHVINQSDVNSSMHESNKFLLDDEVSFPLPSHTSSTIRHGLP